MSKSWKGDLFGSYASSHDFSALENLNTRPTALQFQCGCEAVRTATDDCDLRFFRVQPHLFCQ